MIKANQWILVIARACVESSNKRLIIYKLLFISCMLIELVLVQLIVI